MFNATRMRNARRARAMTQETLGDLIGLSASAVGMYEQRRRLPDADTIVQIAWALGVSLDWLCDADEDDFLLQDATSLEDLLHDCCLQVLNQDSPITYHGILLGMQERLVAASLIHNNLSRILHQRLSPDS